MTELTDLMVGQLADIHAGWSIGSFGAIGEFHQRPDDTVIEDNPAELLRVTEKGGIRIAPDILMQSRCIAYENLSSNPRRWTSGVIFCLPDDQAVMSRRAVVTELGEDKQALTAEGKSGLLFDMGLSLTHVDFCVRTADPTLIAALRQSEGMSVFDPESSAMGAILSAHPHRVVISKLGRVEIYQKIGGTDTGGVSPDGPHTHVLPKLIKSGRTHSSNTPVPEGFLPCLYLHPANPVMGADGRDIPFDVQRYSAFQQIMDKFGDAGIFKIKQAIRSAIESNTNASEFTAPDNRTGRVAARVALRQMLQEAIAENNSAKEERIKSWQLNFDPNAADGSDTVEPYEHVEGQA